jgi:DNA-binding NtrC family response regulator
VGDERTRPQKRTTRVVSRLRVSVTAGADRGLSVAPDDDAPLSIGTSPDNALVLTDPTVSRYHLELRRSPHGIAVVDLGSRNGTFTTAVRVERAVIPAGTSLRIGDSLILVEAADTVVAADANADAPIPDLVGISPAIRQVSRQVRTLARVNTSVLIQGETGTGKEVVARAIHTVGPRRAAPFVVVDCGSLPPTLIASQLFGHERGSFTGADQRNAGAFERANGGTLLLDEIGELPLELQPALLGVLERRRFVRVGGAAEIDVDVRIVAATNRDLRAEVNEGTFRSDLYFRLAVARLELPPLRERAEDIEPLVRHFVERLTGLPDVGALAGAMDALRRHPWAGNARELRNFVEGALVMGHLELGSAAPRSLDPRAPVSPYRDARAEALAAFEKSYLEALIEQCDGNASEAARRAKMDRPYLLTLLRRHGLR